MFNKTILSSTLLMNAICSTEDLRLFTIPCRKSSRQCNLSGFPTLLQGSYYCRNVILCWTEVLQIFYNNKTDLLLCSKYVMREFLGAISEVVVLGRFRDSLL